MDPSQDQESLRGLLLDGGQQHFNTRMVQGKNTPLSLVHFLSLVPWIVCFKVSKIQSFLAEFR